MKMDNATEATKEACAVLERLQKVLERIRDGEPKAPPGVTLEDFINAVSGPFRNIH